MIYNINKTKLFICTFWKINLSIAILYIFISVYKTNNLKRFHSSCELRNKIHNLKKNIKDKRKYFNYILNYKGGSLESEWEWVKNISFVYTWVDGSDANLSYVKSKYNGGNREVNSRDRSADELRYSLRSLKKYLPWHNGTIFIVTDNQTPNWLNVDNNFIKIVSHEEIIPKYINPTFDSSTIECFLDKIPGIGEIFIYLNDDFFFNNYVHPSFFFSSDTFNPKIFRTNKEKINITKVNNFIRENNIHYIYGASVYFTYKIIKKYFDFNFTYHHLAHSAYVCYRSLFEPFREFFKKELKIVFSYRFRCPYKPITLYLYQMLLLYLNGKLSFNSSPYYKEKLSILKNYYSNSPILNYSFEIVPEEITKLFVKFSAIDDESDSNYEKFNYFINNKNILLYNINDKYNSSKALCEFTEFMITRYPENTSFEKEKYVELEKKYLNKLNYANETIQEINNKYSSENNEDNNFKKMFFNEENLNYIEEYLKKKRKLTFYPKISQLELEEIRILFDYKGEKLKKKWKWIKNISFVYLIDENDDLQIKQFKYSLRSIATYLPWFFGTIFIIVEAISINLSWLNINNKHIKIINPRIIVSKKFNNKFSKSIIEMYLDKIPSITERFIYIKPYHYFTNFIHPSFFFNEDFFPKYNFENEFLERPKRNTPEEKYFYKTYMIIKKIFGINYINNYRKLIDSPIPLYRDLFNPVRRIFLKNFSEKNYKNFNLLPLYLLTTYNIYGASQVYFPLYVAGFGEIKNIEPPLINKDKTINYYGFDIKSEFILKKSILNIDKDIITSINKIRENGILFSSINFRNNYNIYEINQIKEYFESTYKNKSIFEK